jgi:deoxyribonuclease V
MKPLHPWNVSVSEAIRIQESLRNRIVLKKDFAEVKSVGGADVAYSKNGNQLLGAIAVLSLQDMEVMDMSTADGKITFPYIPGLLSFREGPILIKAFRRLRVRPDVMIFEGQGIAHPRRIGLASHLGLWLDLPSIGCAKTPLLKAFASPGPSKGSVEWMSQEGEKVGAVLRTKERVKPLFVSPGHRIDLLMSIRLVLETCQGFRLPEPLRKAHQASLLLRRGASAKSQALRLSGKNSGSSRFDRNDT